MNSSENIFLLLILVALSVPLLSAIVQTVTPESRRHNAAYLAVLLLLFGLLASVRLLSLVWDAPLSYPVEWFTLGDHVFSFRVVLDVRAGVLLSIVTGISLLVHLFSLEYMKSDEAYRRYFAVLGLFTFSMTGLVLTDNLLVIFMFWEAVGFCSYLLIGHWHEKAAAAAAAKKAFLMNRVGDIGFMIGIALCQHHFGTLSLAQIAGVLEAGSVAAPVLTAIGLTLFLGSVGKSAQFPLQAWLPDAMEGPTPVSALIHAATMVAAGVYLLGRIAFLLSPDALVVIALTGSITAFMGAVAALHQSDIKKVLAFSTVSQLGYMVMAIGLQAEGAAFFHLYTHAFFKAGLFLAAGSVIHSLHRAVHGDSAAVQDMQRMGGLRKTLPVTFIAFSIGSLSLIGMPLFSGFLSKDAILLAAAHQAGSLSGLYWVVAFLAFLTVLLTAYYVTRQVVLVFFGTYRGTGIVEEKSRIVRIVLIVLSFFSLSLFWAVNPLSAESAWVMHKMGYTWLHDPTLSVVIASVSVVLAAIGSVIAYFNFIPYRKSPLSYGFVRSLSLNNWYLDPLYAHAVVKPAMRLSLWLAVLERRVVDRTVNYSGIGGVVLSHVAGWLDKAIVDGVVNMFVALVGKAGLATKSLQRGRVQASILLATFGLLIILLLVL